MSVLPLSDSNICASNLNKWLKCVKQIMKFKIIVMARMSLYSSTF